MKKFLILIVAIISAVSLSGCISSRPEVLSPLAGYPQTEYVRVPYRTIFLTKLLAGGAGKYFSGTKSVETFSCNDTASFASISQRIDSVAGARGLEFLVEAKEKNEISTIYAKTSKKGDRLKEILILSNEPGECEVVYIKGNISLSFLDSFND